MVDYKTAPPSGPDLSPTPAPPIPPEIQKQIDESKARISDLEDKIAANEQPTLGGVLAHAGEGCLAGGILLSETGPFSIGGCAVGGGIAAGGYMLDRIWE